MACSLRVAGTNGSPAISWDVGVGGYQVGNFPPLWSEWNGKYRDTVRDFWRGRPATLREFASRLTGSSDLYQQDSRRPVASVNFVTCHDGFSLTDLVAYNEKHNKANGEDSRDGSEDNRSWNCGAEGPPRTRTSWCCGSGKSATSWPRCCCPRACRCCWPATRWAAPSAATTTPTARITRSLGSIGGRRRALGSGRVGQEQRAGRARDKPGTAGIRPLAPPVPREPPRVPAPPLLPRAGHPRGCRARSGTSRGSPRPDRR
jgi:hypothetical protein